MWCFLLIHGCSGLSNTSLAGLGWEVTLPVSIDASSTLFGTKSFIVVSVACRLIDTAFPFLSVTVISLNYTFSHVIFADNTGFTGSLPASPNGNFLGTSVALSDVWQRSYRLPSRSFSQTFQNLMYTFECLTLYTPAGFPIVVEPKSMITSVERKESERI